MKTGIIFDEMIFENDYLKVIRLKDGVLVTIYKCEIGEVMTSIKDDNVRKIDDYIYALKGDYIGYFSNKKYLANTKLYKYQDTYYVINKMYKDKKDWLWKLGSTGFMGTTEEIQDLILRSAYNTKTDGQLLFYTDGIVKKSIINHMDELYKNIKDGNNFNGDNWKSTDEDKTRIESLCTDISQILIDDGKICETNLARIDVGRLSGMIMGYWCMNMSFGDTVLANKKVFDTMATDIIMSLYK